MNLKKVFLIGFITWIVGQAFMWLTCGWLFTWVYELPPMIWVPQAEMMNTMWISALIALITSILFVWAYAVLYKGIPGKKVMKGINFGFLMWIVGALSGMITMPFYMTVATTVIIYWIVQALVFNVIRGIIIGAMYKEKV